jgi:ABC-2 type transport system permease protein
MIPGAVHIVSLLIPSTSAIGGFTRLAQLGAPLADARGEFLTLWALAVFYGGVAWILELGKRRRNARNERIALA